LLPRTLGQGFDKRYAVLRTQGFGKCRLYRVYKALKLNLKRRGKRRLPARLKAPLVIPAKPNEIWSAATPAPDTVDVSQIGVHPEDQKSTVLQLRRSNRRAHWRGGAP
jgi:hypothetical protein